jgi:hypothetical protein
MDTAAFVEQEDIGGVGAVGTASASCDVSIGCSPGRVWETGVTKLQHSQRKQPGEQP